MNYDIRPFSLLHNDYFTCLNPELNDKTAHKMHILKEVKQRDQKAKKLEEVRFCLS